MNHHCHSEIKEQVKSSGQQKIEGFFTCPMHPEIKSEKPGMCPECGMQLVKIKSSGSESHKHDKHAGHGSESLLQKFWINFFLTIPVVLYSELPQKFFNWQAPSFIGSEYISLAFGSVVFFYGGWTFIKSAIIEIRGRLPGMMTLIALAISAAYLFSFYQILIGENHTLFWELTTLITVMLLGHWIEMKAVQSTGSALRELSKLLPDTAEIIKNNQREIVPLSELKEGDLVFVRPGGKAPADGLIVEGKSEVNESMITGESRPVLKKEGSYVIAGTTNGDGSLKIRVTKIGEHTFLSGIMRLVKEAQMSKSRVQLLADKAALYLTFFAASIGLTAFVIWLVSNPPFGGFAFAVERLVAVLVIACPHALGLAVPLVASISTTLAAKNGFLIKQRLALENARKINTVLFDKTGTLTKGEYGVERVISVSGNDDRELLRLAASVDNHSEHFIARAIVEEAKKQNITITEAKDFKRLPGMGAMAIIKDEEVFVGGEAVFGEVGISPSENLKKEISELAEQGKTIVYVIVAKKLFGALALGDIIREEAREAVSGLKKIGIKVAMITGDSENVASWVANNLGIDEYFARVLPNQKSEKIRELQKRGLKVAMVGDGINDAPALTLADIGIAIGAGTNIAIESAGIILMRNDPRDIVKIIRLSRATYFKMLQNLFWASGYNIIAMPLAAGLLIKQGIVLQPAIAAVFMSLSTVIVAVNALLLKQKKI